MPQKFAPLKFSSKFLFLCLFFVLFVGVVLLHTKSLLLSPSLPLLHSRLLFLQHFSFLFFIPYPLPSSFFLISPLSSFFPTLSEMFSLSSLLSPYSVLPPTRLSNCPIFSPLALRDVRPNCFAWVIFFRALATFIPNSSTGGIILHVYPTGGLVIPSSRIPTASLQYLTKCVPMRGCWLCDIVGTAIRSFGVPSVPHPAIPFHFFNCLSFFTCSLRACCPTFSLALQSALGLRRFSLHSHQSINHYTEQEWPTWLIPSRHLCDVVLYSPHLQVLH